MAEKCIIDMSRYKAAMFDMDGVITDTMPIHYEAWRKAFEPYGVSLGRTEVYEMEGMTSVAIAKEVAQKKAPHLQPEDLRRILDDKGRIFKALVEKEARVFKGVPETLRMLRDKGLKLALVTGSRKASTESVLSKVGLKNAFDVIVTGEDVENGKPDPEPYLKAIDRLGVDKDTCVVIENAPLGVKSAKSACVDYVIGVKTSLDESYLKDADDIMDTFADLERCLARRLDALQH